MTTNTATPLEAIPVATRPPIPLLAWLLLGVLALVWGSSFILIKYGLQVFSSQQVAAGRILMAWLFFVPFLAMQSRQPAIITSIKARWWALLAAGLLGNLIPAFLFATAGAHLNSSLAGALNSLSPLFTLLLGALFFGRAIRLGQLAGILMGLAGSILLLFFSATGTFAFNGYALLIALATLCYGLNIHLISRYLNHLPSLVSTSWIFMMVGPLALIAFFSTDVLAKLHVPGVGLSIAALCILGILGSAMMTVLFNRVVQLTTPVFAASVTYLMPVVALMWGWVDGEQIYAVQYLGMAICLLGIYLTNKR